MSYDSTYTIEVYDDRVEIRGSLSVREAFDFISFFEKEGFSSLENYGDKTTLYLTRKDKDAQLTSRLNQELLEDYELEKKGNEREKKTNEELKKRISDLEEYTSKLLNELDDQRRKIGKLQLQIDKYDAMERVRNHKDFRDKFENPYHLNNSELYKSTMEKIINEGWDKITEHKDDHSA